MPTLTRRGLLALGGTGAAGAVLAACGSAQQDEREEGLDPELLAAALAAETALGAAYGAGDVSVGGQPAGSLDDALNAFAAASEKRAQRLMPLLDEVGGQPADSAAGETDVIDAENAAIAAYREAAGPLSTAEMRGTAIAFAAAVAAELAVIRGFAGEDQVPSPFVTGGEQEPYVPADDSQADTSSSESETTTTTTTEESQ